MTALGLRQMYDLGTRLRERYVDRFGLISSSFHTDEVFVRSTSKDRTLMSAHVRYLMPHRIRESMSVSKRNASVEMIVLTYVHRLSCRVSSLLALVPRYGARHCASPYTPQCLHSLSTPHLFQLSSKTYALPAGAQPVPIHSADTHNDPLLYGYKICPRCVCADGCNIIATH